MFLVAAILCGSVLSGAKLDGSWYFNTWSGYLPLPKMAKAQDGSISVTDVTAKHGCGILSRHRVPARAGDTMKFTAMVKGKGKMFFRLQDYNAKGKWLRVAPNIAYAQLTPEWKEVTLSVKVENDKSNITSFCVGFIGVNKGGEISVKNANMEVEASDYMGD